MYETAARLKQKKTFCNECGTHSLYHWKTWLDELLCVLPSFPSNNAFTRIIERYGALAGQKALSLLGIISLEADFRMNDLPLRSALFIEEAKRRGVLFRALRGPLGYTGYFQANVHGKVINIFGLPTADFASTQDSFLIDNKAATKQYLEKMGFPVACGKSFWIWQKGRAMQYALSLAFPVVVKPRSGSQSRHVTTDIKTRSELRAAIEKACVYSPAFVVEKYIPDMFVHRATVIDFDFIVCAQQISAHVVGDGVSTIHNLIHAKNSDPKRGEMHHQGFVIHKIISNDTTAKLLAEQSHTSASVPAKGEIVYLQKDPFLKLGGDLVDVTSEMHPDNRKLFYDAAKAFDARVVGIDFLIRDITRSWKEQPCAVLELNSLPCIEMHHFPSRGMPRNVAGAVVDLFFKYYSP